MIYQHPTSLSARLANLTACVLVGLTFAVIGLNAATGCGQGGECIGWADLNRPAETQLALGQ